MREEFDLNLRYYFVDAPQLPSLELPTQSPFACVCVKEMWLLLQLLVEQLHDNGDQVNQFWSYYNAVLTLFKDGKSELEMHDDDVLIENLNIINLPGHCRSLPWAKIDIRRKTINGHLSQKQWPLRHLAAEWRGLRARIHRWRRIQRN